MRDLVSSRYIATGLFLDRVRSTDPTWYSRLSLTGDGSRRTGRDIRLKQKLILEMLARVLLECCSTSLLRRGWLETGAQPVQPPGSINYFVLRFGVGVTQADLTQHRAAASPVLLTGRSYSVRTTLYLLHTRYYLLQTYSRLFSVQHCISRDYRDAAILIGSPGWSIVYMGGKMRSA